jgi:ribonuclease-3 family protein
MDYFHIQAGKEQIGTISNLGLAYLGDAVFEVMIRSWLCLHGKLTSGRLHKAALDFVTAPAQAAMAEKILPLLSEEEAEVFRRGRNTKPHSVPKAAKRGEYQTATALEALLGWLYLQGKTDRINALFSVMVEV